MAILTSASTALPLSLATAWPAFAASNTTVTAPPPAEQQSTAKPIPSTGSAQTTPAPAAAQAAAEAAARAATEAAAREAAQAAAIAATQAANLAAAEAAAVRKAEIDAAKARCTAVLSKLDVVVIYKEPLEDGACGTLAPVELVAVGKSPQVALSPPAILTCDMAAAVHDWVKLDVQPLAKKHLGYPVVRMETMSSYSCRNAFGRKGGKLSEHGKANALDIRGFITAKGETAYLQEDWGLTGVEIAAIAAKAAQEARIREIAEAKAKAEAAAQAQAQAQAQALALASASAGKAQTGSGQTSTQASPSETRQNPLAAAQTIVDGIPKPGITIGGSGLGGSLSKPSDFGIVGPNRLGGPKPPREKPPTYAAAPVAPPVAPGLTAEATRIAQAKSTFLREVHTTACKRFMTTLGPEADKYHRNHFHIDLAERRTAKQICD